MSTTLHKSAKINYEMANLLRLEAFLFIQVRTPNSAPKLKELGCLKLEITTVPFELLGCLLESSMWWPLNSELLVENSRKGSLMQETPLL